MTSALQPQATLRMIYSFFMDLFRIQKQERIYPRKLVLELTKRHLQINEATVYFPKILIIR